MKKFITVLLAVLLTVSLSATLFAAGETTNGTITLKGVEEGASYKLYLLLDLESFNKDDGAYAYKVNSHWANFFASEDAKEYVDVTASGYVTWKEDIPESDAAEFAALAIEYAKEHDVEAIRDSANDGDLAVTGTTGVFSNLPLGYYLVDSTLGSLCELTTTDTDAEITLKNGRPTLTLTVQENSTLEWGKSNTAGFGQTVYYCSTVVAYDGAEGYVFYNVMPTGIDYAEVTSITRENAAQTRARALPAEVSEDDYTVVPDSDGHSFDIVFEQDFCDTLNTGDTLNIYFNGEMNEAATVAGAGNMNKSWLTYSESFNTAEDTVYTYTYAFDLVKTDISGALLDGAQFKIYDAATGGAEFPVVKVDDVTYRPAKEGETGVSALVKNGKIRFIGFDCDTYYLEETVAPEGYNKLLARQAFELKNANLDAVVAQGAYTSGGVQVMNKTGSLLPQTGGMGTTLFLALGAVLVLGAGVLLVARKRMSKIAE